MIDKNKKQENNIAVRLIKRAEKTKKKIQNNY